MTVYGGTRNSRTMREWIRSTLRLRPTLHLRPTLRLRLTLLNALLLIGSASALLVLLVALLAGGEVGSTDRLATGSQVTLTDGSHLDAATWQAQTTAAARHDLLIYGLIAVMVVGVVATAGTYAVAGRALHPLQQVTTTARHLSGETLDQRIRYVGADDEVAELAATFDQMLDRIGSTFETQKRFVANASHELRTPLAVMRTEIDVTLADPDADVAEFRRMARVVRDGSERANALVDALLVLARSEAQAGRRLSRKMPSDLATAANSALAAVRREADRLSLTISTQLDSAAGRRRSWSARPARRQPRRERHPLQPPQRSGLGAHHRRRDLRHPRRQQHRLRGRAGRRLRVVRAVPSGWPGTHRGTRLGAGPVDRAGRRGGAWRHRHRHREPRRGSDRHGLPARSRDDPRGVGDGRGPDAALAAHAKVRVGRLPGEVDGGDDEICRRENLRQVIDGEELTRRDL